MAHADFVDIGECQSKGHLDLRPLFADATPFSAQVASRTFKLIEG